MGGKANASAPAPSSVRPTARGAGWRRRRRLRSRRSMCAADARGSVPDRRSASRSLRVGLEVEHLLDPAVDVVARAGSGCGRRGRGTRAARRPGSPRAAAARAPGCSIGSRGHAARRSRCRRSRRLPSTSSAHSPPGVAIRLVRQLALARRRSAPPPCSGGWCRWSAPRCTNAGLGCCPAAGALAGVHARRWSTSRCGSRVAARVARPVEPDGAVGAQRGQGDLDRAKAAGGPRAARAARRPAPASSAARRRARARTPARRQARAAGSVGHRRTRVVDCPRTTHRRPPAGPG